jgi:hypothetical protein
MIYAVINVCIEKEQRWEGIQRLKELALWLTEKYGAETTLLGSRTGGEDQKQLVMCYQSPAQMQEIDRRLLEDAEFAAWLRTSERLVRWDCAPGGVYPVQDGYS